MSQTGNEAVKSARQVTSNIAGQVGDVASELANRGSQLASSGHVAIPSVCWLARVKTAPPEAGAEGISSGHAR
jgi:glycine cleavage system H lipoate-binding protein